MRLNIKLDDLIFLTFLFAVAICLSSATGFRPVSMGSDTELYTEIYNAHLNGWAPPYKFEYLYEFFMGIFSYLGFSVEIFFVFLSFLSFSFLYLFFLKINAYFLRSSTDSAVFIYSSLALLSSIFFYSAQINVMRQGISCFALFLFFSCLLASRFSWLMVISAFAAIGFHSTAPIFLALSLIFRIRYTFIVFIVIVLSIFYLLGWSEYIVQRMSILSGIDIYGKIISYGVGSDYKSGVRIDFLIFSLFLGIILHICGRFLISDLCSDKYLNFVKLYWLFLIPFLLFGFGAYSDRFLLAPWLFFSLACGVSLGISNLTNKIVLFLSCGVILLVASYYIARVQAWL